MANLDRTEPVVIVLRQDDSMGWMGWLLLGVAVIGLLAATGSELPAMRRYMKMRSM